MHPFFVQITKQMQSVTKGLDKAMQSMDLEKVILNVKIMLKHMHVLSNEGVKNYGEIRTTI
jgi:hypothetical protein